MLSSLRIGNPQDPPFLFLHGLMGSSSDFLPIMTQLQEHFYCIALDLPGHGNSPLLEPLSFDHVLKAILKTLEKLHIKKISCLGYSLGGRLALMLGRSYPDVIDKMIILSAHPGLSEQEHADYALHQTQWLHLLKKDIKSFLLAWYRQPLFKTLDPREMMEKRLPLNATNISAVIEHLSLARQPSLWDFIETSQVPMLFLYGEHDKKYKELYSKLPLSVKKRMIPSASHALPIENPLACSEEILAWLNRVSYSIARHCGIK